VERVEAWVVGVTAAAESGEAMERSSYLSRCSRGACGDSRASGVKSIKDAPWALALAIGVSAITKERVAAVYSLSKLALVC
jgi:hypothetical protein